MQEPRNTEAEGLDPEAMEMNPSTPQPPTAEQYYDDDYEEVGGPQISPRPRYRFLSPLTAALLTLIGGGVGFFVGVRVEKSNAGGSSSAGGAASAFARALGGTGTGTGTTSARSRLLGAGAGGFASLFGGGGGGTVGSVTAVNGGTLYVRETSGNTVKVKLTSATTVTKNESISRKKIYPGDQVTVVGSSGSGGTVTATSVSDSGAGGSSTSTAGASSSSGAGGATSGATSASSAVNSLFGG